MLGVVPANEPLYPPPCFLQRGKATGGPLRPVLQYPEQRFNEGIIVADPGTMTVDGALKRLSAPKFWRKNIEKNVLKAAERQAFTQKQLGHNKQEKCVSSRTLEYFDLKKEQSDCFLESQEFVLIDSIKNEEDAGVVKFNLLDVANSSKKSRLNELFLTLKSLEVIADQDNKGWVFLTFTCPSEYHPNPTTSGGSYNPANDFSAAKDFLNKQFKSFLKYFDKKFERGNDFFGIRVFEAHQDGCPHLHALMFFDQAMREGIENKMKWLHADTGQAKHFENHKSDIVRFRPRRINVSHCAQAHLPRIWRSTVNSPGT